MEGDSEVSDPKFSQAKTISYILNGAGVVVFLWAMLGPPNEYIKLVGVAVPVIAFLVVKYFNGILRMNPDWKSPAPSIGLAVITASMGLGISAFSDFTIFDYSNVWMMSFYVLVAMIALMVIGNKEFGWKANDYGVVASFALFLFGYSFGTVLTVNCYFDAASPEIYHSKILNKRSGGSKSITYYFKLASWGKQAGEEEVPVPKAIYKKHNAGDDATIYFRNGRLNIPWLSVE